jgi:hypothetical protein
MKKLTIIKIIHSLIWIFFNIVLIYLFYAVLSDRITSWVWICLGLFVLEGVVLLVFKNRCPLTLVARKYSDSQKDNFDIYLPNWLARYNKRIYTLLLLIAIGILIYRLVNR